MNNQLTPAQLVEVERQYRILSAGCVEIVPEEGLREKISQSVLTGKPLKVKLGLDPTAPDVHIGHTVVLKKLRQFQDCGHEVQLVIGDFTGRIGDPSGRSATRKQLTDEEVAANAQTYVDQFGKVIDMSKATLSFNSQWLSKLNFADVVRLSSHMTVARMLERDDFEKRLANSQPISIHEFFYPLMQGYDSVALKSDVELGGTDQKFNLLMGRMLKEAYGEEKQISMTMPLLEGLDGVRKMSKSLGNYIGINEDPNSIYGKAMSIPDELMLKYFRLATDLVDEEVRDIDSALSTHTLHPRDAKMQLARTLVAMYHGEAAAHEAQQHFVTVFQQRAIPNELPEVVWQSGDEQVSLVKLLTHCGLASTNSEARRMVEAGAVRINGDKVLDGTGQIKLADGTVVQAGKRNMVRVRVAK